VVGGLLGRDAELSRVARFLDAPADASASCLVLVGDAGIGKTTLWEACVQAAIDRRYRVLTARPSEAETAMPFAALADLCRAFRAAVRSPQRGRSGR
jgi:Cdc6-like AAA superfamily ATPase